MKFYSSWTNSYPRSTPLKAEGGIKAKTKRGAIGSTWWSKRWVSVLDSFGWTNRLERGRRYARAGQVLDIKISQGRAEAEVQGSRAKPYSVEIELAPFSPEEWDRIIDSMSAKAIFSAKLLAGEMPENIEEAFSEAGKSLFPSSLRELITSCSCPDSANPCKHIAAVYYILAEEFDKDPFMIFRFRGMEKERLLDALRKKRATSEEEPVGSLLDSRPEDGEKSGEEEITLASFWAGEGDSHVSFEISPPEVNAAIIKRLGTPTFWVSNEDFGSLMSKLYAEISRRAADVAYRDNEDTPADQE
ncbi:SWIM zinc finger family protein [Methanocella sp. MCL-LM]|uniref:SWIM zinc finger family protein n=1 Tax=Methanocella sp. MCL-LM TaxID=3412035 RepID=UPI003C7120F7